jgi:hypothetical protein
VEGPSLELEVFVAPIKVKKFNIGTNDNPKMASIGGRLLVRANSRKNNRVTA